MPTVKVQSNGRITLPAKIRQQAKIVAGDTLSVNYCSENEIVLTAGEEGPKSIPTMVPDVSANGWEWLKYFDAEEKTEFLIELFGAIKDATEQENWEGVAQLIEEWKATANINAYPDLVQSIEKAETEFAQGEGTSWAALRKELDV